MPWFLCPGYFCILYYIRSTYKMERDTSISILFVVIRFSGCPACPCGILLPWPGIETAFPASLVALASKETPANAGDLRDSGLIPGWGRFPGGGHGNPLQYSCLEKPMDRGALWATVYGVAKSQTWLSDLAAAAAACALEGRSLTTGPPGKSQLPPIYSCGTDRKVE